MVIIIPTYNEEKNIFKLVKTVKKYLPKYKVIVVDDTPNSKSKMILRKLSNVDVFLRKGKKGRGSAVLFGLKKSLKDKKNKIFIEMDADFSHKPSELKRNVKFFFKNKCDLLISSRYLYKSRIYNWSLSRRIFSKSANFLAKNLLGIKVSDYTNGYRIYSRNAAKTIVRDCGKIGDGFIVLSEILLSIYKARLNIKEIESIFVNRVRGESSVNFSLIVKSFLGLIKLWYLKNR